MQLSFAQTTSRRSWIVLGGGLFASLAIYVAIALGVFGDASGTVSDIADVIIISTMAIVAVWSAMRFEWDSPLRVQWGLIALSVALYATAALAWAYYEIIAGELSPMGVPDVFYTAQFIPAVVGLWMALLSFRRVLDLRPAIALAAAICIVAFGFVYVFFLRDAVLDPVATLLERFVAFAYPFGDLFLALTPAFALGIAGAKLAGGRLVWPWLFVALGFVVIAVGDVSFPVLSWLEMYESGSFFDAAWPAGYTLIAFGASLCVDVQSPASLNVSTTTVHSAAA